MCMTLLWQSLLSDVCVFLVLKKKKNEAFALAAINFFFRRIFYFISDNNEITIWSLSSFFVLVIGLD